MAIARNKKIDPAAVAAFGLAAETREVAPTPAVSPEALNPASPTRAARRPRAGATAGEGPASSLIRWKGNEDLRDQIKGYATSERYSEQDVMIRALRLGMEQIENR